MSQTKRTFDIIVAIAGLVLLLPLFGLIWLMVTMSSPGPALFKQTRVGRDERPFVCYKFRTMYLGTAQRATHELSRSAVTPAGAILRQLKLDELPQLWNVLRGDMSLVGPRPCLPSQAQLIAERRKRNVFAIRPGITGLAQVEGIDMSRSKLLAEVDETYVRSQSLGLDIGLMWRTLLPR